MPKPTTTTTAPDDLDQLTAEAERLAEQARAARESAAAERERIAAARERRGQEWDRQHLDSYDPAAYAEQVRQTRRR